MTRSDVGCGHPQYYQDLAATIARETPKAYYVNQFNNPANPLAHETTTAPEIWEQIEHRLDAVVCGVGSGGTLTGLSRYFARVAPQVEMVLADPAGSILADYIQHAAKLGAGRLVAGRRDRRGFYSAAGRSVARAARRYTISDAESLNTARELLLKEGRAGRLVDRHAAGRRPALLPRADDAQAGRHVRLRFGQQISLEDVQRLLDGRPGLPRGPGVRRFARFDRPPF